MAAFCAWRPVSAVHSASHISQPLHNIQKNTPDIRIKIIFIQKL
ncbi:hypothetical protein B4109_1889 [Geobacillus stearothermophilus]|uniref:Uncharacterized protein n=1 Tax=Geobacillus stearothermophilus TaxID=1422 RepID=A0A150M5T9_GEOSE|nr:hypothetical protein B4109_1889 [Geobacillus stearothermophilus]